MRFNKVKTLKQKHESKPYNPLIAKAFFWIKYIEEVGTGTNKIIQWCKEWELPDPDFEYTGTSVVVTLRKSKLTAEYLKSLDLNERQKKAIEYLKVDKKITLKEYKRLCPEVTDRTLFQDLNILVKKGVVRAFGEKRGRIYILT